MPRRAPAASTSRTKPASRPSESAGREIDPVVAAQPAAATATTRRDFQPIARIKITSTPFREQTLSRDRLLSWLSDNCRRRLSLVIAEAGYGKSTLLVDFARRPNIRCLWYKLDSTDGDWVTFLNYLIASAREVQATFGRQTAALLGQMAVQTAPRDLVVATFVAELGQLPDEPLLWVFDDFHAVDESDDVRDIFSRMLRDAPPSVHFCLVTRRRPELSLGRLRAQGELAELDTQQMRFSLDETGRLFGDVYGQPLDPDVLSQVEGRTEGWAASLQLLSSSIRGRSRHEIRSFVRTMSGAEGPIYDFLAEEVLGELDADLRSFLLHAALLEKITVPYIAAAMGTHGTPRTTADVQAWMVTATDMGLLGRADTRGEVRTMHPLLKEFLVREAQSAFGSDETRAIHRRVGRATSPQDWLAGARHLIKSSDPIEAADLVAGSVARALGTGEWGGAAEIIGEVGGAGSNPALVAIRARDELARGRARESLAMLEHISVSGLDSHTRATILLTRIRAAWSLGEGRTIGMAAATQLANDDGVPRDLVDIANAYIFMIQSSTGGNLAHHVRDLRRIAHQQSAAGLHFFAGISLNNAMTAELAAGNYQQALEYGEAAVTEFSRIPVEIAEATATLGTLAVCAYELGLYETGDDYFERARRSSQRDQAGIGDMAQLAAWTGRLGVARELCDLASGILDGNPPDAASQFIVALAKAAIAIVTRGEMPDDIDELGRRCGEYCAVISVATMRAHEALRNGDSGLAASLAAGALSQSIAQGANHYGVRLRLILALVEASPEAVRTAVQSAGVSSSLALLELADVIADQIHVLEPIPEVVSKSVRRWPERWLPELRRQLERGRHPAGLAAASMLDVSGTANDVTRLRAYERTYLRSGRLKGLGRGLARQLGPRLFVSDLGRVELQMGARVVDGAGVRRKAGTLLVYLVSRPAQTATREQAVDDLWPDADPAAGVNNLNQTLYFLRRDIDPWYDEDASAEYVHFRKELLWLDAELVSAASVEFERGLAYALASVRSSPVAAIVALDRYKGRFAPEFEYEEWALSWRDRLQAMYLHGVQVVTNELGRTGQTAEAIAVAQRALAVAPDASDVERTLIRLYAAAGARAAAAEQYGHYVSGYQEEYGEDPPSLDDLVAAPS